MSDESGRNDFDLGGHSSNRRKSVLLSPELGPMFDILRARHRRLILLLVNKGVVERETDLMVRSHDEPDDTEVELVHAHLPKLADAGYIEWNRETGAISAGPRFDEIEPLLELFDAHADDLPPDWP